MPLLPCLNQQRLFFLFLYNVLRFFLILFFLDINKDSIIKIFCCLSISRCKTSPKHKMRVSSPDMIMENRTEQFFIKFVSAFLNVGFSLYFPAYYPAKIKSQPAGETFHMNARRNNMYFPG